jgi:hypothetical protein
MMFGKQVLPVLGELNSGFGGKIPRIGKEKYKAFGPGEDLAKGLASVMDQGKDYDELNGLLAAYVSMMPRSHQEALRAIIYYALTSEPRVLLNFSWAPGYDFEMTIHEMVEPAPFQSGVNIALKGRYPDHETRFATRASASS